MSTLESWPQQGLRVAGLFAGIGGIELGLQAAGHESALLCEIDPGAYAVLSDRFRGVPVEPDVREIEELPPVDLIAAGFPCQDLSQAGRTAGIKGSQSSLVGEVFRLAERADDLRWLLLENVSFMLRLDGGQAMAYLTKTLGSLGYRWAYRIVDTRSFGLPQRRQRVILLASREEDPRPILFADDAGEQELVPIDSTAYGFYWTEGTRGLGWGIDVVPTLKGGSTIGIPSPPAIWLPNGDIVTPDIRDAERLQGFEPGWTEAAPEATGRRGARWKLVGNAVSVPVAEWIGNRLRLPGTYDPSGDAVIHPGSPWPTAAWGDGSAAFTASRDAWPVNAEYQRLGAFLRYEPALLSERATRGFLKRARSSSLRFRDGFLSAVESHLNRMEQIDLAA